MNEHWTYCVNQLPPIGEMVETRSPNGMEQRLKRGGDNGILWFGPEGTYVYYTPVAWRNLRKAS